MADFIALDPEVLKIVFDIAVGSMDFGSGFMEEDDVIALRAYAEAIGVDPILATPNNHKCRFLRGGHDWKPSEAAHRYMNRNWEICSRCKAAREVGKTNEWRPGSEWVDDSKPTS